MNYEVFADSAKSINVEANRLLSRELAARMPTAILGTMREWFNPVKELCSLLESSEMQQLIESGYITVGMVKPRLDRHMDPEKVDIGFSGDSELAEFAIGLIDKPLEVLSTISLKMTSEMVEEFYAGAKSNMMSSHDTNDGRSVWEHFKELMDSGPVTFLVIGSPDGNAIDLWRAKIGRSWDVVKSEPGQLRHLMKSNANNGFHGSDSPQAVKDELKFIVKYMTR